MGRTMVVTGSVFVEVAPDVAYSAVSDPTQMGRWSPENLGATMRDPGPVRLGTVFDGRNRRGPVRRTTRCTVTAVEPGRHFAFRVGKIGLKRPFLPSPIATWEYRFEAEGDGTRVTEIWTDDRKGWPDSVADVFDRIATRGSTFADFQRRNIDTTLRNLKAALEA
ncbi:SRPBCC family protein [Actinocorallia aurea]